MSARVNIFVTALANTLTLSIQNGRLPRWYKFLAGVASVTWILKHSVHIHRCRNP